MSGRISARQDASNVIVSKGPDVCRTPRGNTVVDVPYSSIAFLDTAVRYSSSVRNNGRYDFQLNSRCKTSKGHKPGTKKGVEEHGYTGPAHVETAADFFFSEGFAVVAHRDPAWINRADQGPEELQKGMRTVTLGKEDDAREQAKSQDINTADQTVANPPRCI